MYYLAKREYDYAIRICAYLAGAKPNQRFTIGELSKTLLISKPFTTKIVYQLKKGAIVSTTRGKSGGVTLAINKDELSLHEIFETMGLAQSVSSCVSVEGFCPLPSTCDIHQFFIDQENEIINKLKETTINKFSFTNDDIK